MASSTSGQDEPNPGLWLATRERWRLSCPSGLLAVSRKKMVSCMPCPVINLLLTKIVRSRWLDISLDLFCVFMDTQNIQPSWLHAWSITHRYSKEYFKPPATVYLRRENLLSIQNMYTWCLKILVCIECFHTTSRLPYWCPKTMKRRPCWCPKCCGSWTLFLCKNFLLFQ